jgi:hypothetical protein
MYFPLTQEQLQNIIDELEGLVSKDKATFGIFQYGGSTDESFIQANKDGLKLFALELLKAATNTSKIIGNEEKNVIPLAFEENWINKQSDTLIRFIEFVDERPASVPHIPYREGIIDKLIPIGCIVGSAVLFIASLIGLWTLYKWFF